jgi:predicted nuclease of restriction endonuclease-like (RecB) superfamily
MKFATLLQNIGTVHNRASAAASRSVDQLLTVRNWLIGAYIIEYEQNGEDRAAYGERVISRLAAELKSAGYRGLGTSNLKNCRQVALRWPNLAPKSAIASLLSISSETREIRQTPSGELGDLPARWQTGFPSLADRVPATGLLPWQDASWTQRLFLSLPFSMLLELSRLDEPLKRGFYEAQSIKSGWSLRELKRQRDSMLYERVGLSKDKDAVVALSREGALIDTPATILRDPYVLEFLGLEGHRPVDEAALEQALLEHLQEFLLELGRDFCFMGRQFRITVGGRHHFIDLLFYHRSLRCLVAIDLKTEPFKYEHAGQMHFYVNYLAEEVARPGENRPIGIVLCTNKDAAEVHYATGGISDSVFVSRYLAQLPSPEQLERWLLEERSLIEDQVIPKSEE